MLIPTGTDTTPSPYLITTCWCGRVLCRCVGVGIGIDVTIAAGRITTLLYERWTRLEVLRTHHH